MFVSKNAETPVNEQKYIVNECKYHKTQNFMLISNTLAKIEKMAMEPSYYKNLFCFSFKKI